MPNALRRACRLCLILGGLLAFLHPALHADSPLLKTAEHKMQHARVGPAAVALDGQIYIFGGSSGNLLLENAERLDIASGAIRPVSAKLLPRVDHQAIVHEGKVYLFGGSRYSVPTRLLENQIEVFDPTTNTVEIVGRMPDPRTYCAAVKIGSEAWFIGGWRLQANGTVSTTNTVVIYDFATGAWRDGPPMPTPRDATAVTVGQFVIVSGGYSRRNRLKAMEMYVPQEGVWKRLPELSHPAYAHSAAVLGQWLFIFGDLEQTGQVLAYDLPTRRTQRIRPGFTDTSLSAAVTHDDRIYVIGGSARGLERNLIQVFGLNPDWRN